MLILLPITSDDPATVCIAIANYEVSPNGHEIPVNGRFTSTNGYANIAGRCYSGLQNTYDKPPLSLPHLVYEYAVGHY